MNIFANIFYQSAWSTITSAMCVICMIYYIYKSTIKWRYKVNQCVDLNNQSIIIDKKEGIRVSCLKERIQSLEKNFKLFISTHEMFAESVKKHGECRCLGTRSGSHTGYDWLNYRTVYNMSHCLASALVNTLQVMTGNDCNVAIYAKTCKEWIIADLALNINNNVSVPLYDTLGKDAMSFIMQQTQCKVVFCGSTAETLNILKLASKQNTIELKALIIFRPVDDIVRDAFRDLNLHGCRIEYMYDLINNCGPLVEPIPQKQDDLFTICYTSGTTGLPKGCMITHANFINTIVPLLAYQTITFGEYEEWGPGDSYLGYLPLAHILERYYEYSLFSRGASIGYYSGNIKELMNDVQCLKPTQFCAVPRVLQVIYDTTMNRLKQNRFLKLLMNWAIQSKLMELRQGVMRQNSLWDYLFFNRIRAKMGGRIRLVVTGSAPISDEILEFTRAAFSCWVVEGYGQTETTAGSCHTAPEDYVPGHVGMPFANAEVKLVDVPNLMLDWRRDGRGEICVRGSSVFKGYYKMQEETNEVIDSENWLHTGDIGMWTERGCLKIIDRCKNVFKLSQGEYIAPDKVESILLKSSSVSQIYVDGNSYYNFCVAIVVPDFKVLYPEILASDTDCLDAICADVNGTLRKSIIQEIDSVARSNSLNGFEIPKRVHLCREEFTVQNGLMTPTMKLKRTSIRDRYSAELEALYK